MFTFLYLFFLLYCCFFTSVQTIEVTNLDAEINEWIEVNVKPLSEYEQKLLANFVYFLYQTTVSESLMRQYRFALFNNAAIMYSKNDANDIYTENLLTI